MVTTEDLIRHKIMDGIRGIEVREIDYKDSGQVSFHYNGYRVELEIKIRPETKKKSRHVGIKF